MIKTEKLGEIRTKMIDEVKKADELKVILGFGWGAELTGKLAFNPSEDLKIGDEVKVIIERVYEEPEPEEEKEAVTGEAAVASETEGGEKASTDKLPEPLKAESAEPGTAGKASEPLEAEVKVGAAEAPEPLKAEGIGESPAGEIKRSDSKSVEGGM